jgi:integrase
MARQRKHSVHGGGSVFLRKDGRWEAKFKVEETGKYKSLYADTEKEAYKKLEEAKFQQRQGTLATGPDQTVRHFLEYWLEDIERPSVRLRTYVNNRVVVYKHLIPGIGHVRLQKLTAHQLQLFYAKKLREGTSASRVVRLNAVLHKALDHARRIKLVGVNVADKLDLPKPEPYEAQVLTLEQARLLLREAAKKDLDALIALALITGMRKGEILALRWSDVNLDSGVLQVARTVSYYAYYHFQEGKAKTKSSERSIALPPVVVNMLISHREAQQKRRLQAGEKWVDNNLVFCNRKGGVHR